MRDSELRDSVEIGFGVDDYGSECKPGIGDSHEVLKFAIQGALSDGKSPHLGPQIMSVRKHVHAEPLVKGQEPPQSIWLTHSE